MDGECVNCGEVGDWCECAVNASDCLDCGVCESCIERSIAVSEEFEADNTDELIEAMKEGFAVRLADVEAKLQEALSTLKSIRTWAAFEGGVDLDAEHLVKLCDKVLKGTP